MIRQPGLILLDKPPGLTSFQALGPLKRALGTKKIGHTGTLDRFASGLLVLLVEKATKLVPLFTNMDKIYRATFTFGYETATLDPEGDVIFRAPLPAPEAITNVLPLFLGEIQQIPPVYSAIHVDGKRAYQRTLAGEQLTLPSRDVTIHSLKVHTLSTNSLDLTIHCSKGTYIRSLCRDISHAAGTRGTVTSLRRESVGHLSVDQAVNPDDFDSKSHVLRGKNLVMAIPNAGSIEMTDEDFHTVKNGTLGNNLFQASRLFAEKNSELTTGFLLHEDTIWGMIDLRPQPKILWLVPRDGQ